MAVQDTLKKATNPFGVSSTPKQPYQFIPAQVNQNQQPQPETPPQVLGSSTGGSTGDAGSAALYDEQIRALRGLLGLTDSYEQQGKTQISDSYNRSLSRLNEDQSRNLRDIGIQREETAEDKRKRLGGLDDDIYRRSEGLKRMFARAGSGVSGAAQIMAPGALGREFSGKRGEVFQTFGRNKRRLDTAETDTKDQYGRSKQDLDLQRDDSTRSLISGFGEQWVSLNEQMQEAEANRAKAMGMGASGIRQAIAPYTGEIERLREALLGIFAQYRSPAMNVSPINPVIPELEGYAADPTVQQLINAGAGDTQTQSAPYFPLIRREEEYV